VQRTLRSHAHHRAGARAHMLFARVLGPDPGSYRQATLIHKLHPIKSRLFDGGSCAVTGDQGA
jgi:hypothetical protein